MINIPYHKGRLLFFNFAFILPFYFTPHLAAVDPQPNSFHEILAISKIRSSNGQERKNAYNYINAHWQDNFTPMILELIQLNRYEDLRRGSTIQFYRLLQKKTKQRISSDVKKWQEWLWNKEPDLHPYYAAYKFMIYGRIDRRFEKYFRVGRTAKIRLDEVVWGGVRQDAIPPLRHPKMIDASEATFLSIKQKVFGLMVNDTASAYPQRILAWHEMVVDEVGGEPIAGVYCTLCGSLVIYKTKHKGVNHQLGTSGFLYRSNKLMYDKNTQSLWSTLRGEPVIGPLADEAIKLDRIGVVTTSWGEWKRRHPATRVMSIDTGYSRDYGEGAAYREYFSNDELMFAVPKTDKRLKNKSEVLGLIFSDYPTKPIAISVDFLNKNPIYHDRVGDLNFVVLTDKSGANRVYDTEGINFKNWDGDQTVVDENDTSWRLSENRLVSTDDRSLLRLPAHRTFWFGWFSTFMQTRLVK